ncbi:TIGR02453 family protein [Chitinophaga costaii]|uniref:TIGR02453 family protein n=1 Tax=Chitinophaga costaii TaxID=1335309 RepID=A0A1C4AZ32_9BACT|nr:DUF2461 domain-containing protein [Chitinophaga costaii]PUZ26807.1 DUF2461 domain-containing protein [Chitinophaga costaii]SCB99846.1 TIGR02453 family protein [Chitinophaga costaii]
MPATATEKFLLQLRKHNNKEWFDAHKKDYLAAKLDFEQLVQQLLDGLAQQDPTMAALQVKDCVFRIYKDVRFSKDKTPYKTNMGASFQAGGKKSVKAGYYFHYEPGGHSFAGGGLWMPAAPELKKVRQEIDYNFNEFQEIIEEKNFKKYFGKLGGEVLKTVPQGYTADNPAIAVLRYKSFTVNHHLTDESCTKPGIAKEILKSFAAMQSLLIFLNRALE